jgi:dimethylhistidine N-methyltransferase
MKTSHQIPEEQNKQPLSIDSQQSKNEILRGLFKPQKEISPKYLYDSQGSALFEQICSVEEYYPTRTEISILQKFGSEISRYLGENCLLIEFGAGSSLKTRILLKSLNHPHTYVPIDISKEFLLESAGQLQREFPGIPIFPIPADYTHPVLIPTELLQQSGQKVAFFPGSTFGNFDLEDAVSFLKNTARIVGKDGLLLLGIDLIKDKTTLEKAYNDSLGITAAFNLNILSRMNRELQANFDLRSFFHRAHFNTVKKRIEMHIVSLKNQLVTIAGEMIAFREGESIHTESSYKFSPREFENFIETVGFSKLKLWTDPEEMFAVYLLEVKNT